MFEEPIILDEARFTELTHIDMQQSKLEITNPSDIKSDADALIEHLEKVKGIDRIKHLTIDYNSSLTDLRILQAFPGLEYLNVYGKHIMTFDGIEWFKNGEYLWIQTEKNWRRDISQITLAKFKRLTIFVERPEDLTAIGGCRELEDVELSRSMEPNFEEWTNMPAATVSFKSCRFKELGNFSLVPNLKDLIIIGCRNLEKFKGDNSNVKWMIVEGSRKLDLRSLRTFSSVEVLTVNNCTQPMNLSEISGLEHVRSQIHAM